MTHVVMREGVGKEEGDYEKNTNAHQIFSSWVKQERGTKTRALRNHRARGRQLGVSFKENVPIFFAPAGS